MPLKEKNDTDTDIERSVSQLLRISYEYRKNFELKLQTYSCISEKLFQEFAIVWWNWNDNRSNFYFFLSRKKKVERKKNWVNYLDIVFFAHKQFVLIACLQKYGQS